MKKFILTLTIVLMVVGLIAQVPLAFKYQAVVRGNAGDIMAKQAVGLRISIRTGSPGGTVVYQETHSTTTNQFGLAQLNVGEGTVTVGTFSLIDWDNTKYLEVELDPSGGSSYVSMGTSQLISVPYAIYSENTANVDDADADPGNELQTLSLTGDELSISDGNAVVLPAELPPGVSGQTIFHNGAEWEATGNVSHDGINVGIGTSNPDSKLHVNKGSAGAVTAHGESALVIENNSTVAMSILTPSNNEGVIYFGDNTNSVAGGVVYNHPNDAMSFRTGGNSEKMIITSDGSIGIGTSIPAQKLDVIGTAQMTGFQMPTGATDGYVLTSDGGGVGTWQELLGGGDITAITAGTGLTGGGTTGSVTLNVEVPLSLSATSYDGIIVGTNSGEGYGVHGINTTSGNFGVLATNDGTYQNDGVYGYAPTGSGVHGQTDNGTGVFGECNTGTGVYGVNFNTMNYGTLGTGNYGVYGSSSTGHAGYFDGEVFAGGNVGIGTTSPARLLHIYGTANPRILVESPSDQAPELNLKRGSVTYSTYINSNNDLVFYQAGDRVTFKGSGNVGIGTSDPSSKLHISAASSSWGMLRLENSNTGQNEASISFREGSDVSGTNTWLAGVGLYGKPGNFIIGRNGEKFIIDADGNLGIGSSSFSEKSTLFTSNKDGSNGKAISHRLTVGNTSDDNVIRLVGPDGSFGHGARLNFGDSDYAYIEEDEDDRLYIYSSRTAIMGGYVGIGTTSPSEKLTVRGNIRVESTTTGLAVVELGEGLDYAEGFDVTETSRVEPGTVLSIDPNNPGELTESNTPYDTKVAGIVAGANNLGSGVKLGAGQFDCDVALAGRVYCNVDATYGEISAGDLLTTSPTPGYAMIVKDNSKAQGAILGKAMESLEKDKKGQILVLVTLQ